MKHLILFILSVFLFLGCTPKTVEINPPKDGSVNIGKPIKETKKEIGTPIEEEKVEEVIETVEEEVIEETEMPIIDNNGVVKIAYIYPSKLVAKYAKSSINTVMAYFAYRNINYDLKVFDTKTEAVTSIASTIEQLKAQGYNNVIALFTPRVIETLSTIDTSGLKIYFPLINKPENTSNSNFIFGAIDYDTQIIKLLEQSNGKNTMFYQQSFIGNKLKDITLKNTTVSISKKIESKRNYFKGIVKDYRLRGSSLFLNTSVIKSSILLSQLRAYNIKPNVVLSTQLNYNPKIFSLTQSRDRQRLVVASSIGQVDDKLVDIVSTYGANIKYNWVDYSTLVGINYIYDENNKDIVNEQIEENQVVYYPRLFKTTNSAFLEIK